MTAGSGDARPRPIRLWWLASRGAIALYPSWWRERYEPEQLAFMEDLRREGRSAVPAIASLVGGAVSVRLRPAGMPRTVSAYRDRTRASVAWAMVAGWVLLRPIEALQGTFAYEIPVAGRPPAANIPAAVALDVSRYAGWGAVALLLVLFACYLSLLNASSRATLESSPEGGGGAPRWRLLAFLPLILCAAAIAISELHSHLGPYEVVRLVHLARGASIGEGVLMQPHHPLLEAALGIGTTAASVAFLVLSPIAVVAAFRRVDLNVRDLQLGVVLSRVVAAAAGICAIAAVTWSYAITHQTPVPTEPMSHGRILGEAGKTIAYSGARSPNSAWWPLIVLAAITGFVVCAGAAHSARSSSRAAYDIAELGEAVVVRP